MSQSGGFTRLIRLILFTIWNCRENLLVWIWNRRNYEQNDFWLTTKCNQIQTWQIIPRLGQPIRSTMALFEWKLDQSTSNSSILEDALRWLHTCAVYLILIRQSGNETTPVSRFGESSWVMSFVIFPLKHRHIYCLGV